MTAGYLLGENWHIVEEYGSLFSKIFLLLCVAVAAVWIAKRVYRNKKSATARCDSGAAKCD